MIASLSLLYAVFLLLLPIYVRNPVSLFVLIIKTETECRTGFMPNRLRSFPIVVTVLNSKYAMKTYEITRRFFSKGMKAVVAASFICLGALGMAAQNSLPAPGSGGSFRPNPGPAPGLGMNGIGWNPGPPTPAYWGSPWYTGWNNSPTLVVSPSISIGNFPDQGLTKVIANGYDAQGVWRVLPMLVSYQYNGVQYDVNVINAWDPWTDQWDKGLDLPAYNTNYLLRNVTYDFYTVLPYGTLYFNL